MGIKPGSTAAIGRTLRVLDEMVRGGGQVEPMAERLGLPVSTAYRQVAALVEQGCLVRISGRRYAPGPRLLALLAQIDPRQIVVDLAGPTLDRLARDVQAIVQLGTLEQGMVTYRAKAGRASARLFTKVGMQLEAYCSAVGKVLLAHLPDEQLDTYLANGPFVALTATTITDPLRLRAELDAVRARGFAVDDNEVADGLYCLAMPLHLANGSVQIGISVSRPTAMARRQGDEQVLSELARAVREIESGLGAVGPFA